MAIHTPNGLKIRLDPEVVSDIVAPLASVHDMEDVLMDVELWEDLPEGVAAFVASVVAVVTQSPSLIVAASVLAYAIASLLRGFAYLDFVRVLFPLFLGHKIIATLYTLSIAGFLYKDNSSFAAIVLCVINLAAYLGVLGIVVELPLALLRVPLRKVMGLPPTHQEQIFMAICDRRAKRHSISLDWRALHRSLPTKATGV